jgi:hypothetical protein
MKQFSAIAQTFLLTSFSFSALSLLAIPVQAASFRGLGFFSDSDSQYRSSEANGVSADGSVVVGRSRIGNEDEAFRWTPSGGMVSLGSLTSGVFFSFAEAVSADGSVVVGGSNNVGGSQPDTWYQGFRWTQSDGMLSLGSLGGSGFYSLASSVSADGSIVVGSSYSINRVEAFRWTQADGMLSLGFFTGDDLLDSRGYGVSADGSIVVGSSVRSGISSNLEEAFRWTQSGDMVGLGDLLGGAFFSRANGVSADGSVIVGFSASVNGYEAFRWTQSAGMIGLGSLGSYDFSSNHANDVSSDGSIIVGKSGGQAFRWTQSDGMVSLKETLIGAGLDVSGWSLTSANAISADGFTIVGNGINPSGQSEAWVANLSPEPIPEPLTILGSIAAIAFAAGFERKFGKNKSDEKDPDA